MSVSAYRKTIVTTETPRQIERRILSQINAELSVHQDHFDNTENRSEKITILSGSLRQALSRNVKFWAALQLDLISPGNGLPTEVRAGLISLARFSERQSKAVLAGEGRVKPLIDINKSIIDGLSGIAHAPPERALAP